MSKGVRFFLAVLLAHVFAYLIAGGITYQLITKDLWEGPDSLLSAYLRTPGDAELWKYAMIWQIPAQILRGALIALVLLPLLEFQTNWKTTKKIFFYAALTFVLTHLCSAAPSPANIEGWVYMKPAYVKLGFIKMQPEMLLHSIIFGFIVARYGTTKDTLPKADVQ